MKIRYVFISLIWGAILSAFLQFNQMGRFLAQKRTWITVVIGVGVDLIILLFIIPFRTWVKVTSIIVLSSVPIIFRSLSNELAETLEEMSVIKRRSN